jgi:hypothetical protein
MKVKSILSLFLCALILATVAYALDVQVLSVDNGQNRAPVAENISLCTYKNVSVSGTFQAVDPEGDLISYRLDSPPDKGNVAVNGEKFVYTPTQGKKGKDSFTYVAIDAAGNTSRAATVSIRIDKQNIKLTYSDLKGDGTEYYAIKLAENNIFTGEKLLDGYHFNPDKTLTRGEFLTMCAAIANLEPLPGITKTGFSDDADISMWLKPYVSAALMSGVIRGYSTENGSIVFAPDNPVTLAEAAVMLNNTLNISDVIKTSNPLTESVPAWAKQAADNLSSCDIYLSSTFDYSKALTRADAAELLCAAIDLVEARGDKRSLLSWAF